MAKKTAKITLSVPAEKKELLRQMYYRLAYIEDVDDSKILDAVESSPHLTASEIAWMLEKKHGIKRRPSAIKNFAKRVGLSIKS